MRAIDLDRGALDTNTFHVANDTDGGDHPIDRDVARFAACLDGHRDVVGGFFNTLHGGAGQDRHALPLERLVREGGNFFVLDRKNSRQHFNDRDLDAEVEVETGEFDADRAGADDQQRFRHDGWHHRVPVRPDQLAVSLHARQFARPRAGGQDDVRRLQCRDRPGVLLHRQRLFAGQPGGAVEHRDLVLAHQVRHARGQLFRHRARPFDDSLDFERRCDRRETVVLHMMQQMVDLTGAQQRLGRDAAPVEADAAQVFALHDRCFHSQLGCPDRRDIAAGTAAHDDQVETLVRPGVGHFSLALRPGWPARVRSAA
jgi:hypothetical protein